MFAILRKIRRSLIESSSVKKYLVYAVGEILLVMIGILLALQVNNWNERRKSAAKEGIVLEELKNELESNITILEASIGRDELRRHEAAFLVDHIDRKAGFVDSVRIYLGRLRWHDPIVMRSAAFESLESSGFDLIRKNALKMEIIRLFDYEYNNTTQWMNTIGIEKYRGFNGVFEKLPKGSHRTISENYQVLLGHDELYNMITTYKAWKSTVILRQKELLDKTVLLKSRIEQELL